MGCGASTSIMSAEPTTIKELHDAIAEADSAAPVAPVGEFAETWDDGATFHWSGTKEAIPVSSARVVAERRAMRAVQSIDYLHATRNVRPGKCAASYRGVRSGWLMAFASSIPRDWTTAMVVERKVRPETASRRCRHVELQAAADVGEASVFISHTWGALFCDLVAAILYVASDETFVWLDIFAVRQWPGNGTGAWRANP